MLALRLEQGNEIHIGDAVVRLNEKEKLNWVRLVIEAPKEIEIWREPNKKPGTTH